MVFISASSYVNLLSLWDIREEMSTGLWEGLERGKKGRLSLTNLPKNGMVNIAVFRKRRGLPAALPAGAPN
jgi:hypothetical protein